MVNMSGNIAMVELPLPSNNKELATPLQDNLIKILQQTGPITRRDLVKQLNSPRTTIYDNLLKLQRLKVVEKFSRTNGNKGRPLVYWILK